MEDIKRRRRGAALQAAVLEAAWEEIVQHGYAAFTVDGVAARARTSKAVLYRRWPSRSALARAAIVDHLRQHAQPVPDTGDLREDVLSCLRESRRRQNGTEALLIARMEEFGQDSGTALDELFDEVMEGHESVMAQIMRRAEARGEVDPDKITERIVQLPMDLFWIEVLKTSHSFSEQEAEEVVDTIFLPLVR